MAASPSQTESLLSTQINTVTRAHHTTLNRLITSRLPLCMPPYANSPALYTFGFSRFAAIYLALEDSFADLASSNPNPTDPLIDSLLALRPIGLERRERLFADLARLQNLSVEQAKAQLALLQTGHDEKSTGEVAAYVRHISESCAEQPCRLLAYCWCYYMAVFSGGRWIRAQLKAAGPAFWSSAQTTNPPPSEDELPLAFWHFDGAADGEDIKAEFKQRFEATATLLTLTQRQLVLAEAGPVFEWSARVVAELDALAGTDMSLVAREERHDEKRKVAAAAMLQQQQRSRKRGRLAPAWAGLWVLASALGWFVLVHLLRPLAERIGWVIW